ncbi:MAG TPA: hypothetical protein VEC38_10205 [Candidatus Binataceae bacterium]|nr:hypothetical protein [Candidatus Binataceae bacterium]
MTIALSLALHLTGCITLPPPALAPSSGQEGLIPAAAAPLDPPPILPEVNKSPCPRGLAWCFDDSNARALDARLRALKEDALYCRQKYDELRNSEEKPR